MFRNVANDVTVLKGRTVPVKTMKTYEIAKVQLH